MMRRSVEEASYNLKVLFSRFLSLNLNASGIHYKCAITVNGIDLTFSTTCEEKETHHKRDVIGKKNESHLMNVGVQPIKSAISITKTTS